MLTILTQALLEELQGLLTSNQIPRAEFDTMCADMGVPAHISAKYADEATAQPEAATAPAPSAEAPAPSTEDDDEIGALVSELKGLLEAGSISLEEYQSNLKDLGIE
jgi:hypothetical protein